MISYLLDYLLLPGSPNSCLVLLTHEKGKVNEGEHRAAFQKPGLGPGARGSVGKQGQVEWCEGWQGRTGTCFSCSTFGMKWQVEYEICFDSSQWGTATQ